MTTPEPALDHPRIWGPQPLVLAACGLVTAVATLWLVLAYSPTDRFFAGILAVAGLSTLVCGLLWRRRLVASSTGLRVGTLTGVRTIRWSQVAKIDTVTRRHLGIGSAMLHLDLDEDGLFIFGRLELGTDPEQVATELRLIRRNGLT